MSYGPNLPDLFRRAADITDKILHGTKPGDIPVEQPTKFDLIINLTTAKALGKDHPQVAKLLEILRITKQSLGRVLKQLIRLGYVVQMEGANDRRQRLLYVTSKGETLAMKLAELQTARIARALAELGPNARETACRFLAAVINAEQRDSVLRLIARADRGRRPRG